MPDSNNTAHWEKDLMASVVVFLVALPLCMGIAIASGVPPAAGLLTGIIGGLVVGFLAGQPLQVSGPAAGLAVMVWQLVKDFGLEAMGLAVLLAGVIQLIAGIAGMGRWFRAVAPAVIQGMLAGIGVLIFASQFHVMVDDLPRGGGLSNLLSIPEAVYKGVMPSDDTVHHMAAAIGITTIASIVLWNRFRPARLKVLPGPLAGVLIATIAASMIGWPIAKVDVPDNLVASITWLDLSNLKLLGDWSFIGAALGLAVIASAETLLCATAVDRIHPYKKTDYNKELRGQGIGNILCGVVGALPMTGVIVRSSANVEAGGRTKWSAIFHGVWILLLVGALPKVLELIPTSSLAAILVYTGWKLLNLPSARRLFRNNRIDFFIWLSTVVMIVATDLLIGVLTGFALALAKLLWAFTRLEVEVETVSAAEYIIRLHGAATFVGLPKLAHALESVPDGASVHVVLDHVAYVDHACLELLEAWEEDHNGEVHLEMQGLADKSRDPVKQRA